MISRKNRFQGRNSLNHMYRSGKTVRGEFVALKYCANNRDDYRLAVVVSKKVSKLAVRRNKIRRRIYETVRILRKKYPTKDWSYDMAITIFDESLASQPYDKIYNLVETLLKKSKVL